MTNKALVLTGPAPEGKWVIEDHPIPNPAADQIVIRSHAIALNPIDWKTATPGFATILGIKFPKVIGNDLAGTVESVGSSVSGFKPGDRVMSQITPGSVAGAFQQYVLGASYMVAKIPDEISFAGAATLPVSVTTAAGQLMDVGLELSTGTSARVNPGEAILIWGAGSSVGTSAVQLARAAGATIFATASPHHHEYLRELGADALFDYKSTSIVEDLQKEAASRGVKITRFIDTASGDLDVTANVVSALGGGSLAIITPWEHSAKGSPPENVKPFSSGSFSITGKPELATKVMNELTPKWLASKALRPAKIQAVEGGLGGIEAGLAILKKGVSGVKLVVEV